MASVKDSSGSIEFSTADVENMLTAIDRLFAESGRLFNQNQFSTRPDSIVAKESAELKDPSLIETTLSIATLSMEAAGDHLAAFSDLLKAPSKTLAPFTCARSLMEMSALACWLFDPSIDGKTRIARTYAHRYSEFVEQRKTIAPTKNAEKLKRIALRMETVEKEAVDFGFLALQDKNGDICGIAQPHPNIIDLIGMVFDKEFEYRLLSGITHGRVWALQQIGFKLVEHELEGGTKIKGLTKTVVPNMAVYFGMVAVWCFARVLYDLWQIFGWDVGEIVALLETIFDDLKYSDGVRFWRK